MMKSVLLLLKRARFVSFIRAEVPKGLCGLSRFLRIALLGAALSPLGSAIAAVYTLPGSLPPGCSSASSTSFSCANLNLAWNDSIIVSNTGTTLTITNTFKPNGNNINTSSPAGGFTINAGTVDGSNYLRLNGNLNAANKLMLSSNSNDIAGNVTAGGDAEIGGKLSGTLTVGGDLSTGWATTITGNISAESISSGGGSTYGGDLVATDDDITTGTGDQIAGSLTAKREIVLNSGTVVVGDAVSTHDEVTLKSSGSRVGGSVTAKEKVTLESGTSVGGSVTSTNDEVILKSSGSSVGGSVSAKNKVTLESGTSVGGNVTSLNSGVELKSSNATVGQCVTVDSNRTITLGWHAAVGGVCCQSGGTCGTACVANGSGYAMPALCTATPSLSIAGASASEGNAATSTMTFTVTQSAVSSLATTVNYATGNLTATGAASCSGGADYVTTGGVLTIPAGATTGTITVSVCGDVEHESDETFSVTLSSPSNALLGTSVATGTIVNDDSAVAICNSGALSAGVINTYYPGVSVSGSTITLGSASGASTGLAAGDLVLVVQMQDAAIDTANGATYGTASSVNAGKYEYATVQSVGVGSVTLSGALSNTYSALTPGNDSTQQKTFQVIRVPVYSSGTLPAAGLTAKAWDGSTGGVLAFDVIGTLNLGTGSVVDVSGKGFRGGGGYGSTSGSGSTADYRTPAKSNGANGAKGEGIAGTPYRVFNGSTTVSNAWEGYPNGSNARGAPANAGGGGTDGNPSANDENTGGGGGANKGAGGQGGIGWCGAFDSGDPSPYGCDNTGGFGGKAVSALAAAQLTLGGGGGAATSNNSTGTPAGGVASSGAPGGGIVMIRAGALSGTATINANGSDANDSVRNDGSGGGGAGGAVLVSAASGLNGLTVNARGGEGGSNLVPPGSTSDPHGPGGGGGGGFVVSSTATAGCTVSGGASGVSYEGGVLFGAYGATAGSVGSCVTGLSAAQIPGAALGQGPCAALLHHYAISYPLGNPGVTCEALAVRVTAHDSGEAEVVPAAGTQITLSTTPAAGGWTKKTGGGSFSGGNQYTFDGIEKYAEFWLTQTTPTTAPHIDIDVSDGAKSEIDGSASEDAKAQFVDTAFKYYDCSGAVPATCSEISINQQIAGKPSSTAPGAQTLYLRAVRQSSTTGACTGGLSGEKAVDFAYECDNPANCYGSDLLSINGGAGSLAVARNNDGSVSSSGGSYTSVNMIFSADGYAPFTFNYADVGAITLHARKVVAADSGTPPSTPPSTAATIYGASNSFVVKPYGFKLSGLTCAPADARSSATGAFCVAGGTFSGTVTPVIYTPLSDPISKNLGAVAPSFGHEAVPQTVSFSPNTLVAPTTAAGGALDAFTSSTVGSFSGTPNAATATMVWPNVGTITIKPTIDYLGTGDITADGISDSVAFTNFAKDGELFYKDVGRFYPAHFTLVSGAVTPACGAFTYMGQPNLGISYAVEARNKGDAITNNYLYAAAGGYPVGTVKLAAENADAGVDLNGRISVTSTAAWLAGKYAVNEPSASFSRSSTPDGAYDALAIGVRVVDLDASLAGMDMRATTTGICTTASNAATDCDAKQLGSTTKVRFGRLWLGNAYGSDQRDLALPFQTQYWNGTAFVKNTADNCTALATAHLAMGNPQGGLGAYVGPLAVSATVAGGGTITLSKPAGSASGSVDLAVRLGSAGSPANCANPALAGGTSAALDYLSGKWCGSGYDRDPVARATFGVFGSHLKKGPIYIRENF